MSSSPPPCDAQIAPRCDSSELCSLVYDLSQQVQVAMENMLKMINEVDQCSAEIMEEIEKSKESALQRKKTLEEEKEHFEKAAYAVLDLLNHRELS